MMGNNVSRITIYAAARLPPSLRIERRLVRRLHVLIKEFQDEYLQRISDKISSVFPAFD